MNTNNTYDSTKDTISHINAVKDAMYNIGYILISRGIAHDATKLHSPEKDMYDKYVPQMRAAKYGSPEYKEILDAMNKEGLNHHYEYNSHHPEHFENGVNDMSLFDIFEMFADHMVACKCGNDVEKFKTALSTNAKRFGFSEQLESILLNTFIDYIGLKK